MGISRSIDHHIFNIFTLSMLDNIHQEQDHHRQSHDQYGESGDRLYDLNAVQPSCKSEHQRSRAHDQAPHQFDLSRRFVDADVVFDRHQ